MTEQATSKPTKVIFEEAVSEQLRGVFSPIEPDEVIHVRQSINVALNRADLPGTSILAFIDFEGEHADLGSPAGIALSALGLITQIREIRLEMLDLCNMLRASDSDQLLIYASIVRCFFEIRTQVGRYCILLNAIEASNIAEIRHAEHLDRLKRQAISCAEGMNVSNIYAGKRNTRIIEQICDIYHNCIDYSLPNNVVRFTARNRLNDERKEGAWSAYHETLSRDNAIGYLKSAQKELGLSQRKFAEKLGIAHTTLGQIYNGEATIDKIVEMLGRAGFGVRVQLVRCDGSGEAEPVEQSPS